MFFFSFFHCVCVWWGERSGLLLLALLVQNKQKHQTNGAKKKTKCKCNLNLFSFCFLCDFLIRLRLLHDEALCLCLSVFWKYFCFLLILIRFFIDVSPIAKLMKCSHLQVAFTVEKKMNLYAYPMFPSTLEKHEPASLLLNLLFEKKMSLNAVPNSIVENEDSG